MKAKMKIGKRYNHPEYGAGTYHGVVNLKLEDGSVHVYQFDLMNGDKFYIPVNKLKSLMKTNPTRKKVLPFPETHLGVRNKITKGTCPLCKHTMSNKALMLDGTCGTCWEAQQTGKTNRRYS